MRHFSISRGAAAAVIWTALALGPVRAEEPYRPFAAPDMDLSRAAMSPAPLGPPATFEPVPAGVAPSESAPAQAAAPDSNLAPDPGATAAREPAQPDEAPQAAAPRAQVKPAEVQRASPAREVGAKQTPGRSAAKAAARPRTKTVTRRRNPLDAQASDTRIQVWPCRSGGICNWRPATQPR